jgi:hypothetical protein
MQKNAVQSIWKLINEHFPDYRLKNNLLVRTPIGCILCGILFESSAFSKESFYLNAFVQPLYVPAEHLVLTFGMRIPGQWEYDQVELNALARRVSQALRQVALRFHQDFGSLELFYRNAARKFSLKNIHLHQSLAFTAIHLGKIVEAQDHFKKLESLVDSADQSVQWIGAVLNETHTMLEQAKLGWQVAHEKLRTVESQTIKALKLDDLPRSPDSTAG